MTKSYFHIYQNRIGIKSMFAEIEDKKYKWRTPIDLPYDSEYDELEPCPRCGQTEQYTFNCTNVIDGAFWTLINCSKCKTLTFELETL